jgi:hypothetical protein
MKWHLEAMATSLNVPTERKDGYLPHFYQPGVPTERFFISSVPSGRLAGRKNEHIKARSVGTFGESLEFYSRETLQFFVFAHIPPIIRFTPHPFIQNFTPGLYYYNYY